MNNNRLNEIYYNADNHVPVGSETVKELIKEIKSLRNNKPVEPYLAPEEPKPEIIAMKTVEPPLETVAPETPDPVELKKPLF